MTMRYRQPCKECQVLGVTVGPLFLGVFYDAGRSFKSLLKRNSDDLIRWYVTELQTKYHSI